MTTFQLRKIEVSEGREAMLYKAGWVYDGPAAHKDTTIGKYWVNPRSGLHYTMDAAVALVELREALSPGKQKKASTINGAKGRETIAINTAARRINGGKLLPRGSGARINFIEPQRRNRNKSTTKLDK